MESKIIFNCKLFLDLIITTPWRRVGKCKSIYTNF